MTLLQHIGHDLNVGIKLILPYSLAASSVLAVFMPGLGTMINVGFIAVAQAEAHFSDVPSSGPQKLEWALMILTPIAEQFLPDKSLAKTLVSDIADLLNKYDPQGNVLPSTT